jgi:TPR repeat protein
MYFTNLAILYKNGEGVSKDINKAISLFLKAIKYNYPRAIRLLGKLYHYLNLYDLAIKYYVMYNNHKHRIFSYTNDIKYMIHNSHKILWKPSLHKYLIDSYDRTELDNNILLLLLISKYRRSSNNDILQSVIIKGIILNIIKYICHHYII